MVLASVLLCLCACGARQERAQLDHAQRLTLPADSGENLQSNLAGSLPELPLERQTLGEIQSQIDGAQPYRRGPGTIFKGSSLRLTAAAKKLSWAIWELPSDDELLFVNLTLENLEPAGGAVYAALADYQRGAWELSGPLSASAELQLDELRHRSPGGAAYLVVLAWDQALVEVAGLTLTAFHVNQPPAAILSADVLAGHVPLLVQFDASGSTDPDPGDTVQQYFWDFDGDGVSDLEGSAAVVQKTFSAGGVYSVRVVVQDSEGLQGASEPLQIDVNSPPQAQLAVQPQLVNSGDTVNLDASLSTDADGSVVLYEWDGDGYPGFESSGSESQIDVQVHKAGEIEVRVRVTDDDGATSEAYGSLQVSGGYAMQTLDEDCQALRMILVDGNPAIAYVNPADKTARYMRAQDALGSSWNTDIEVSGADPEVAGGIGLAIVNGNPAIAYISSDGANLRYVRASDASGTAWGDPLTVASPDEFAVYCDLQSVNGNPAIAFASNKPGTSTSMHYVRASDATGATWPTAVTLDTVEYSFEPALMTSPCLRVVNGRPAVCYVPYEWWASEVSYVRADDASGSSWPAPQTIPDSGSGLWSSMELVDGKPLICFYASGWRLSLVRATDADGSAWSSRQELNTSGSPQSEASISFVDGKLSIAFQTEGGLIGNEFQVDLSLIQSQDALGLSWDAPIVVEHNRKSGQFPALVGLSDGSAGLAACNHTFTDLRYYREN